MIISSLFVCTIPGEINKVLQPSCIPKQQQQQHQQQAQNPKNVAPFTTTNATTEAVASNTIITQLAATSTTTTGTGTASEKLKQSENGLQLNESLNFPDEDENSSLMASSSSMSGYVSYHRPSSVVRDTSLCFQTLT